MPKLWKQEEIQIILDAKNKKSIKIPGRSKKSIHRQLVKLGLVKLKYKTKKHSKRRWTQEELKVLYEAKDKLNVKLPGRTRNSILAKLGHLKLIKRQKHRKPWLKKEDKLLLKLLKEGKSAKEIFLLNVLPYSKNSIQKKICFLGLAKKQNNAQYFSKETREAFKKFLLDNWQGETPEDLRDLWNEKNSIKVNRTKVIYHLGRLKIKIPYGEVARIKKLRKKEIHLKESILSPKDLTESLRFTRAEMMRKRISQNRDLWTGLPLSEETLVEINEAS
jgi:hypothetical protein